MGNEFGADQCKPPRPLPIRAKTVQRVRHGDVCSSSPVSQYSGATRFGDFWIDRTRVEAVLGGSQEWQKQEPEGSQASRERS
jgi:hypothetical protein